MNQSSEIQTYQRLFAEKYREIDDLLADLPAEALLWKPFAESPWRGPAGSLGWIIAHSISSTVYLLRRAEWSLERIDWDAVDGDEGSEEFAPASHEPAYLRQRAERSHTYVRGLLDSLTPVDLDRSRPHPLRPGDYLNARYDVVHAIEHMSQHVGHAQLTRQLWALFIKNHDPLC